MCALALGFVFIANTKKLDDVKLRPIPLLVFALFSYWIFNVLIVGHGVTPTLGVSLKMTLLVAFAFLIDNAFQKFARPIIFLYALNVTAIINLILFFIGSSNSSESSFWGSTFDSIGLRFGGTFRQPNELGMCLAFTVFYLLWGAPKEKWIRSAGRAALVLASLFLIVQTGSKLATLLAITGLLVSALGNLQKHTAFRWIIALLTTGTVLVFLYNLMADSEYGESLQSLFERYLNLSSGLSGHMTDSSTSQRLRYVQLATQGALESPVLGKGLGSFAAHHGTYSHTTYLELLYNGGVSAFILYYARHLYVFVIARQLNDLRLKKKAYAVLLLLAVSDLALVSYNLNLAMVILIVIATEIRQQKQLSRFSSS